MLQSLCTYGWHAILVHVMARQYVSVCLPHLTHRQECGVVFHIFYGTISMSSSPSSSSTLTYWASARFDRSDLGNLSTFYQSNGGEKVTRRRWKAWSHSLKPRKTTHKTIFIRWFFFRRVVSFAVTLWFQAAFFYLRVNRTLIWFTKLFIRILIATTIMLILWRIQLEIYACPWCCGDTVRRSLFVCRFSIIIQIYSFWFRIFWQHFYVFFLFLFAGHLLWFAGQTFYGASNDWK